MTRVSCIIPIFNINLLVLILVILLLLGNYVLMFSIKVLDSVRMNQLIVEKYEIIGD